MSGGGALAMARWMGSVPPSRPPVLMWLFEEINVPSSSSRIAIVGSGAVGGFYGLMLARAGLEVHFLLRSEYQAVAKQGLLVRSKIHGDLRLEKVNAYHSVHDMPLCDWLLVGAKATSNADLAPLIAKA